jgi:hypothetical protein
MEEIPYNENEESLKGCPFWLSRLVIKWVIWKSSVSREKDVANLLMQGKSNKQIAHSLVFQNERWNSIYETYLRKCK